MGTIDTTRRTLAQAKRMPQWQRLITSVHDAQAAAGYDGRQFGAGEMRHFGATLIGRPVEHVPTSGKPGDFSVYWVERQTFNHSDDTVLVSYVVKAVYGDNLAHVETINRADRVDPTPELEAVGALDAVKRAHWLAGRAR